MYDFEGATQETKDFVLKNSRLVFGSIKLLASKPEGLLTKVVTRYCEKYNVDVPYFRKPV
jgi:hypothetical protein